MDLLETVWKVIEGYPNIKDCLDHLNEKEWEE